MLMRFDDTEALAEDREMSAGATVRRWLDSLRSCRPPELRAVIRDPGAPQAKRIAAARLLEASRPGREGAAATEFIVSHTDGRAVRRQLTVTVVEDPEVVACRLLEQLRRLAMPRRPDDVALYGV